MVRQVCVLAFVAACSSSTSSGPPADVSGSYTVAVTNRTNGCTFPSWNEGNVAPNIPFTITQNGANISGSVGGLSGAYTAIVLGTNSFSGTAIGTTISMTAYGTRSTTQGQCAYTINATISGTLNGNELTGQIKYTPATNHAPDCGTLESCVSQQDFDGTRPPK
jgi:hypothetical protein